ncbi:MAG TPA: hypothetical protein VGY48_14660, partial [Vicinamibacterales bacterium]|nr:hypothetical protein [Vicinamibacterales bacterium]
MRCAGLGGPLLAVALVPAAACTLGPDYKRPVVNVPSEYRGEAPTADPVAREPSLGDQKWWQVFQDEQLQELIRTALNQNFDLRIAVARVLESQALVGIARADQFPRVDVP